MVELIKRLFDTWNKNGVSYCHWKSIIHLEETMKGTTDLDILVDNKFANSIEKQFTDLGFKRFDTVSLRSYPGIHDYIGMDDSGIWIHLHLHYILNLGDRWVKAYWLPMEDEILSRVQFSNKFNTYIINPYDELMLHCLRMSLKFHSPFNKKGVLDELYYLKSRCKDVDFDYGSISILQFCKSLKKIMEYVFKNENLKTSTLNKLSRSIAKEVVVFRRFARIKFSYLSWKRKIYRYYIEFRRRKLRKFNIGRRKIITGGKIIAIVGIDGSGKTTTLSYIERFFAIQMNISRVFLGNGKSGASWYRKILFSVYGTKKKVKNGNIESQSGTRSKVSWLYALWILVCLFDKEKNLKKVISGKANGSLVLSDRWPQTEFAGTFDGPRINVKNPTNRIVKYVKKREEKFLNFASLIKPDLIIILKVSPDVSMKRKPGELSLEEAQRNSSLLNNMNWGNSKLVEVDSDLSANQVNKNVKHAIWKELSNEY